MSPRWFGQEEVSLDVVIELEKRWRVLRQKEKHGFQGSEQDDPRCINGYMRIYKQIPTEETVADRPKVRAQQAKTVVPPELGAYRQLMDEGSWKLFGVRM
ncbi:uncharacterized protein BO87DRAFT_423094 [Aspergillus neoniger CBS 115656]|uniref:Uncharacterized protein n=1 Tax=Aspergillus neoniger (strain CBS 115656) TaxID=1448310 RepID=A0A318YTZ1_ASPNB|nr:hypothetical protein BO87DRAFT_423094 [Aspergillus neoniger CBS 115656]PYH37477.1 hypothetical protein BO87DRAFT_423094 [Aspergillus neoniger CBS 115656]